MKHSLFAFALTALISALPLLSNAQTAPEWAGTWVLIADAGNALDAEVTFDTTEAGRLSGQGPCNRWFATQTGKWPDLTLGPIGSTRMACPSMGAEAQFFDTLAAVTHAELAEGGVLRLTTPDGRSLSFTRAP
jgi:heat shock protein HslJ